MIDRLGLELQDERSKAQQDIQTGQLEQGQLHNLLKEKDHQEKMKVSSYRKQVVYLQDKLAVKKERYHQKIEKVLSDTHRFRVPS